jgi:ABC-type uncharacterized transport system permease subunit
MPPDVPTPPQFAVLFAAGLSFAVAFVFAWRNLRLAAGRAGGADSPGSPTLPTPVPVMGAGARAGFAAGVLLAVALIAWRLMREDPRGVFANAVPLFNYFDLFLLLALLLAVLAAYFRLTRHLPSLAFFLLPMIALVLTLGGVLSLLYNQTFDHNSVTNVIHVASIMLASACFILGCAGGVVYLLAARQLKKKGLTAAHRWLKLPSLASLEKFNQTAVIIGFPLLTLAMITGGLRMRARPDLAGPGVSNTLKIVLALVCWGCYGVLVHVPLAPSFRGRRAAWLSIAGFVLLVSVFFAVRYTR